MSVAGTAGVTWGPAVGVRSGQEGVPEGGHVDGLRVGRTARACVRDLPNQGTHGAAPLGPRPAHRPEGIRAQPPRRLTARTTPRTHVSTPQTPPPRDLPPARRRACYGRGQSPGPPSPDPLLNTAPQRPESVQRCSQDTGNS